MRALLTWAEFGSGSSTSRSGSATTSLVHAGSMSTAPSYRAERVRMCCAAVSLHSIRSDTCDSVWHLARQRQESCRRIFRSAVTLAGPQPDILFVVDWCPVSAERRFCGSRGERAGWRVLSDVGGEFVGQRVSEPLWVHGQQFGG